MQKYKRTTRTDEFFDLFMKEQKDVNFDILANYFRSHPNFNPGRAFQLDVYINCFMVYHRYSSIKRIIDNSNLDIKFTEDYWFDKYYIGNDLSERCFVYYNNSKKENKRVKWRCDNLLFVEEIPVMLNFRYKRFPKVKEENAEFIIKLFRASVAYGIITTSDNIGRRAYNFEMSGGYIINLSITKKELKENVRKVCEKNKFLIR